MPEKWMLEQYQSLPLQAKVGMSMNRIIEWYDHFEGNVCVSFSGGKDSTVLAHLVHDFFPQVPLVFADTGLEYPEIRKFAEKMGAEFVRPKMRFDEVISKYGYPLISKEVAEAIHFARRIVPNSDGGVRHKEAHRRRGNLAHSEHSCTDKWGGGGSTAERKQRELLNLQRPVPVLNGGGCDLNGQAQTHRRQTEAGQPGGEETSPG